MESLRDDISLSDLSLALLTGIAYPVLFVVPRLGIAAFLLFLPLLTALRGKRPRQAFLLGLAAGTAANFAGQYWLIGTLTRFGGFPLAASALFHLVLSLYEGLMFAVASYLTVRLRLTTPITPVRSVVFASLWTSLEFLFPYLFPYGVANLLVDYTSLIQVLDLFGLYALGFVVYLVNYALYGLLPVRGSPRTIALGTIALAAAAVLSVAAYGVLRLGQVERLIGSAPSITVGVVQGNFDYMMKTQVNEREMTAVYDEMSRALAPHRPRLVIWPETAVQAWISTDATFFGRDEAPFVPSMDDTYFLVGGLAYEVPPEGDLRHGVRQYNVAVLVDPKGTIVGMYRKMKLLLFGEYLPFSSIFPAVKRLSPASGDFTPGTEYTVLTAGDDALRIAPLICYEDILPPLTRRFAARGATLLVNLTNDAWFGRTVQPYQHLRLSVPRAVETRRYLVRATNTGISAVVDPAGRVVVRSGLFTRESLVAEVGLIEDSTLYTRVGDLFAWACVIWVVLWVAFYAAGARARRRAERK